MTKCLVCTAAVLFVTAFLDKAAVRDSIPEFDDQTVRALTAIAETGRAATSAPGLLVGVWAPGKGRFVRAFGTSDLATNAFVRLDDHFRIASNTKTFTATAILQLVDEGSLSLDASLSQFVGGIPYGDQITVRELLNMTAGIYDYVDDETILTKYKADPLLPGFTALDAIEIIKQHQPDFVPGTSAKYSDSNYLLLGLIVEKITGRSVGSVIQTKILDKLGMRQTSFPTTPAMPRPFSRGYFPVVDGVPRDVTESNPNFALGAGAMISTLGDLRIWAKALATGTLLSPATQQLRLQTIEIQPGVRYGLGITEINGFFGHTGGILGYGTAVFYLPEADATFVVISNSNAVFTVPAANIFVGLAYYLFPEQFPNGI